MRLFEKAVFEMTPEAVIKTVTDAGLRGRGGAGFPAGKKWTGGKSEGKDTLCSLQW